MEYEVKLYIDNGDKARSLMNSLGLTHVDTCIELDVYYIHPCRDFRETDEAFRFRVRKCTSGVSYTATYKGPRIINSTHAKIREEIEVNLDEYTWKTLRNMVEKLGFTVLSEFTKKREIYQSSGLRIYIDTLIDVGEYVEVEALDKSLLPDLSRLTNILISALNAVVEDRTYLEICLETSRCRVLVE